MVSVKNETITSFLSMVSVKNETTTSFLSMASDKRKTITLSLSMVLCHNLSVPNSENAEISFSTDGRPIPHTMAHLSMIPAQRKAT